MTTSRERDEHGQYTPEHTDEEILDAIRKHEPASTMEIADEVGFNSRSSTEYRLNQLTDEGRVYRKKAGHSLVWMLTED